MTLASSARRCDRPRGGEGATNFQRRPSEVRVCFQEGAVRFNVGVNGDTRSLQPDVAEELVRIGYEAYEWRRRAGLTQRAVEALTGIDQTTICKFERGHLPGLRLHHVARIRLACKTGRRVDSTYGRRPPTRSLMTPHSSQAGDDFGRRAGTGLEPERLSRKPEPQDQAEDPPESPPRASAERRARAQSRDAIEVAPDGPSIGRVRRAPRRR
jgi:transcriptional regulator with XRE-family HTH domain